MYTGSEDDQSYSLSVLASAHMERVVLEVKPAGTSSTPHGHWSLRQDGARQGHIEPRLTALGFGA